MQFIILANMISKNILLFLLLSSIYCHATDTVCVRSSDSVRPQTGVPWEVECTEHCSSISECNFSHWSSTTIVLESGYHNVMRSSTLQFSKRNRTVIQGSILGTTISCAPDTGLAFINGTDISISNLVIESCSFNYSTYRGNFASAVLISGITNVQLMNVTISHSLGSAISLINVRGNVTVENSKFLGNVRNLNLVSSVFSIYYSVRCNSSLMNSSVMSEAELLITNSNITSNSQGNTFDTISNHMIVGLSISFDGCTSHISITVKKSVFSGSLGKGILVHFQDSSTHNSLIVSSSNFSDITHIIGASKNMHRNDMRGEYSTFHHAGGGISVLFDGNSSHNVIVLEKSNFTNNTAITGGGLFIAFLDFSHNNKAEVVASNF